MRILGWSHSHGGYRPFHSHIDHGNVLTVVEQLASANLIMACRKVVLQRKGARLAGHGDSRLRVTCLNGLRLPAEVTVELPVTYGYVYSVTVNATQAEPDARIGIQTLYPLHDITTVAQYQSRVRLVRDARLPRPEARKTRQMLADIDERMPTRGMAAVM
jgi:hypothetical protein